MIRRQWTNITFMLITTSLTLTGIVSGGLCTSVSAEQNMGRMNAGRMNMSKSPLGNSDFSRLMTHSMTHMDQDMMAAPMTGDPDHDFAAMMIPHHQGAIAMAQAVLLGGKDSVLRRMAQEIIVTQEQEIDVMQRRLLILNRMAVKHAAVNTRRLAETGKLVADTTEKSSHLSLVPSGASPALSGSDRVYTADQTSNTVSVIDPFTNTLLGLIRLGDPVPAALSPLYKGALLVHGLGFSPDHRTLAVVSIGSNSVTLIDTATNAITGTVYVGRSPHEAFFTPSGKQLWVAVRGEDYVSVIDPIKMKEIRRIPTANGPGMVLFRPDGRYAFVPSSFTPELDVVDVRTYQVAARIKQTSVFSPNLGVSKDGAEVWFTLKDTGKTQVISAKPPFETLSTLTTGPITNHVALVDNANGHFAYITVGGLNVVKVYRRGRTPVLAATIPTGDLPHGIWPSGDGTRVYIGLENGDAVQAIDTLSNKVIATIPVGQLPQAVVYVPNAVSANAGITNAGITGLVPLGEASNAAHLVLTAPTGSHSTAQASVAVNSLGLLDNLQIAATGLIPGQSYQLSLVPSLTMPYGNQEALIRFKANASGSAIAQALGPLRQVLTAPQSTDQDLKQRFLIVTEVGSGQAVLLQAVRGST